MLQRGLAPDAATFSTLINRFCRADQLDDAKSVLEKMIAHGFKPDAYVFDSLLKGFYSWGGEKEEIIHLLHKMAGLGGVLDSVITSTILTCLTSEDLKDPDVVKLLSSFPQQTSQKDKVSHQTPKIHPNQQLSPA